MAKKDDHQSLLDEIQSLTERCNKLSAEVKAERERRLALEAANKDATNRVNSALKSIRSLLGVQS